MIFNTELATVLAQVMPIFLLMLMFERMSFGKPEASHRVTFTRTGYFIREIAAALSVLVFTISLIVIAHGEDLTGWTAWATNAILVILVVLLGFTVRFKLEAMREEAVAQAEAEEEDDPTDERNQDG